jgi:hypothetical protein
MASIEHSGKASQATSLHGASKIHSHDLSHNEINEDVRRLSRCSAGKHSFTPSELHDKTVNRKNVNISSGNKHGSQPDAIQATGTVSRPRFLPSTSFPKKDIKPIKEFSTNQMISDERERFRDRRAVMLFDYIGIWCSLRCLRNQGEA